MDDVAELCAEFERLTGVPSSTMVGAPVRALRQIVDYLRRPRSGVKPAAVADDGPGRVLFKSVTMGEVESLFVEAAAQIPQVPITGDRCGECGRERRLREHWARCASCHPDEVLHICPACIEAHQEVHVSRGDAPPAAEPDPAGQPEPTELAAAGARLDRAILDFDDQVAASSLRLGPPCKECGKPLRVHIGGRCIGCWRAVGKPEGELTTVEIPVRRTP
jgi:hypothetical protein